MSTATHKYAGQTNIGTYLTGKWAKSYVTLPNVEDRLNDIVMCQRGFLWNE